MVSADVADAVDGIPFGAGLTYNSHAIGLAAARAILGIYESDGLIERAAKMGEHPAGRAARAAGAASVRR